MTIIERINTIINSDVDLASEEPATIEKMIVMAYWMGREASAREVSDMYNQHIREQRARANACRYSIMANKVVGPENYLYCADYAQSMTETFGSDPADK